MRKALREPNPAASEATAAVVEQGVDLRRELRVLNRVATVALDEGEDNVLAAEAGEQVIGRGVAEGVDRGFRRELLVVEQTRAYAERLVVGEDRRVRGRDRHAGHDLGAEHRADQPHGYEHGDGAGGDGPAPDHDAGQPPNRQRHENHQGDDEQRDRDHCGDRPDAGERVGEQVHEGTDLAPVENRVERPGEYGGETEVEKGEDGQHAEDHAGERRQHPPRPRREQDQDRDTDHALHREAHERARREACDLVRSDERDEHEHAGQCGNHPCSDGMRARGEVAARDLPRPVTPVLPLMRIAPQPHARRGRTTRSATPAPPQPARS